MARVTIADDNASVLFLLQEIIAEAGHDVVASSSNGSDALKTYYKIRPDITVLDNKMPGMNGIEVARIIRAQHAEAKVILCTADFEEIRDLADELGIPLIGKPFHVEDVVLSIQSALRNM